MRLGMHTDGQRCNWQRQSSARRIAATSACYTPEPVDQHWCDHRYDTRQQTELTNGASFAVPCCLDTVARGDTSSANKYSGMKLHAGLIQKAYIQCM
jgi:hypothetical protein